jgi:hypothetical protein
MAAQKTTEQDQFGSHPCGVCGNMSDPLALTCPNCGAYLRERVAGLNFFETVFAMIENPRATFLRVARSEQKNYVLSLFAVSGIAMASIALFAGRAGDLDWQFATLLAMVFFAGPLFGMIAGVVMSWIAHVTARRVWKFQVRFRIASSFVAYSFVPLLFVSCVIVPIELAVFGVLIFSENPAPWAVKPVVFWTLAALNGIFFLWEMALASYSLQVLGLSRNRSVMTAIVSHVAMIGLILLSVFLIRSMP